MTFVTPPSGVFPIGPFGSFFWGGYWAPVPSVSSGVTQISGAAELFATATSYSSVALSWSKPAMNFDVYALVRNATGWPLTPSEGSVVVTGGPTLSSFTDSVASGGVYYYTLFVRLSNATPQWASVGSVLITVPVNHSGGEQLFELLPEWYQLLDADSAADSSSDNVADLGQLRRFLELPGFQTDILRTEAESIGGIYDPNAIRADLLAPMSDTLGFPFEPNGGYRQVRLMMQNWFEILKTKGSKHGVKLYAESLTGYSADVTIGKNMHLGIGDSHLSSSSSKHGNVDAGTVWQKDVTDRLGLAGGGAHILGFSVSTVPSPIPAGVLKGLHVIGNNSANLAFTCGDPLNAMLTGIPIAASTQYTWTSNIYSITGTTNFKMVLMWFDANGAYLSDSQGAMTVTLTTWVENHLTATSPANAAYCIPGIKTTTASTETYVTKFQFEQAGAATTWEPARQANITLYPNRVNYFPNPSFEGSIKHATVTGSSALSITTADKLFAARSLKADLVGDVTNLALLSWDSLSPSGPIVIPAFHVGDTWSIQAYVKGAQTSIGESVTVTCLKFSGVSNTTSQTFLLGNQQWTQVGVTGQITQDDIDNGLSAVEFLFTWDLANTVAKSYYIDAVLIERNSVPGPNDYFDGNSDLTTTDFAWASTVQDSPSMYFPNRYVRSARLAATLFDFLPVGCLASISYSLPTS